MNNDENRNELNAIVNLLGDIMVQMQKQNEQVLQRLDRMDNRLGSVENAIISLAKNINAFVDVHREQTRAHEERIRRLEDAVFRKGA